MVETPRTLRPCLTHTRGRQTVECIQEPAGGSGAIQQKDSTPGSVLSSQAKKRSRGSSTDDTAGQQRGEDTPGEGGVWTRISSSHRRLCETTVDSKGGRPCLRLIGQGKTKVSHAK